MGYLQHAAVRASGKAARQGTRRSSLPSPVKGLNTRDSLTDIKPGYALNLVNYFPSGQSLELRRGTLRHTERPLPGASGASSDRPGALGSGAVRNVFSAGPDRLYAVSSTGRLVDVTDGDTGTRPLAVFTAGSRLSVADMNDHTILCNGTDFPARIGPAGRLTSDHGWHAPGLDVHLLSGVLSHKNRLFFLEKGTANLWYGGLFSVQGLLTRFPLSGVARGAGNAVALGDMTVDGGEGPDDRLFVFMESGDVLVYLGSDIASSDTWRLGGVYRLPPLVGDSPLVHLQGDLLALTRGGLVSMSSMQRKGRAGALGSALTTNVFNRVEELADTYGGEVGWDLQVHGNMLLVSVPVPGGLQLVMNTVTGAWCEFKGMDAHSWHSPDGEKLYYGGGDGHVYSALDDRAKGTDHANVGTGQPIEGLVQFAYSNLRIPQSKHFKLARLLVESDAAIDYSAGVATDYDTSLPRASARISAASGSSQWNKAEWNKAEWGSAFARHRPWKAVNRFAVAVSMWLVSSTKGARVKIHNADLTYEVQQGTLI